MGFFDVDLSFIDKIFKRENGESPTLECRHDSHEATDKQKRRKDILFVLENSSKPLTAMEIAEDLFFLGKVNRCDRNVTAPRLTEMCADGTIEPVGKKKCQFTGRMVTCYQIRSEE
jgi:hypothetical protein